MGFAKGSLYPPFRVDSVIVWDFVLVSMSVRCVGRVEVGEKFFSFLPLPASTNAIVVLIG